MLAPIIIPQPIPAKQVKGYKMTVDPNNLLTWDFVATQMTAARHYWISTVYSDGRPHVVPVWGIWSANRFHFEGGLHTAWAKNLARNPQIAVHLPDGEKVVIIHGLARIIEDDELDADGWSQLDTAFQTKYQVQQGSPFRYVQPQKVLAWDGGDLQNMTRWLFK